MQPDDTASPVSLGARGILGARLENQGRPGNGKCGSKGCPPSARKRRTQKTRKAAAETGRAKPPAGSRRYEGKGCPPALRLRSEQEGCHEGDPGAKNAALKAAALSATADANGARDDECRGGAASSASPGAQEHRQDCLCHKCESQGGRPARSSGTQTARYKGRGANERGRLLRGLFVCAHERTGKQKRPAGD
jgi:hypothetical protein